MTKSVDDKSLELRPYQKDILRKTIKKFARGEESVFVQSSPGSGKTLIMAELAKQVTSKNGYVLSIAHRQEIIKQTENRYQKQNANMDLVDVKMIQTAARHVDELETPDLIIIDEAHHTEASSYLKVLKDFSDPKIKKAYFSATPWRADGKGFTNLVKEENLILGPSTKKLIEDHYLSDFTYYQPKIINDMALKFSKKGGDFTKKSVDEVTKSIDEKKVVEWYKKLGNNEQGLVYAPSIEVSKKIVDEFNKQGISAFHLDGASDKGEREEIIDKYKQGKIKILSNVEIFTEGLDLPNASVALLARPTMSLSLYLQFAMRVLRYQEGKHATIIDFVGNGSKLGLPSDDFEWSLRPHEVAMSRDSRALVCDNCKSVFSKSEVNNEFKIDKKHNMAIISAYCPNCGSLLYEEENALDTATDKEFKNKANELLNDIISGGDDLVQLTNKEEFRKYWLSNIEIDTSRSLSFNYEILREKMNAHIIERQAPIQLLNTLLDTFYENVVNANFSEKEISDLVNTINEEDINEDYVNNLAKDIQQSKKDKKILQAKITFANSMSTNEYVARVKSKLVGQEYYEMLFNGLYFDDQDAFIALSDEDLTEDILADEEAMKFYLKLKEEITEKRLTNSRYMFKSLSIVRFKSGSNGIKLIFKPYNREYSSSVERVEHLFTRKNDKTHLTYISARIASAMIDGRYTANELANMQLLEVKDILVEEVGKTFLVLKEKSYGRSYNTTGELSITPYHEEEKQMLI